MFKKGEASQGRKGLKGISFKVTYMTVHHLIFSERIGLYMYFLLQSSSDDGNYVLMYKDKYPKKGSELPPGFVRYFIPGMCVIHECIILSITMACQS